jgi:hypothetical protein
MNSMPNTGIPGLGSKDVVEPPGRSSSSGIGAAFSLMRYGPVAVRTVAVAVTEAWLAWFHWVDVNAHWMPGHSWMPTSWKRSDAKIPLFTPVSPASVSPTPLAPMGVPTATVLITPVSSTNPGVLKAIAKTKEVGQLHRKCPVTVRFITRRA